MITTSPVLEVINATLPSQRPTPSDEVDKTTFLKLLVMQLRYQDPIDPMKSEQFLGQVAQFNALEQQINLNDSFDKFLGFQALTQASSLIGKEVQAISTSSGNAELVGGVVEEVILLNGMPILKLSTGDEVSIEAVVKVGSDLSE
ncbi:MAG: flagellar hook capping FlgD N-terminal domain-containing protein [bacterium]